MITDNTLFEYDNTQLTLVLTILNTRRYSNPHCALYCSSVQTLWKHNGLKITALMHRWAK